MPKLKASKKSLIQSEKAQIRNRATRTAMRSAIKAVRTADDPATAKQALVKAASRIDKTAKKGVIHKKTADRYKSRLTKLVQKLA
ncbi:MAG: 30S ribosomal protein S20 [Candidatus Latescibacteria bacterium]|nr:30S ribosomal protein S20 [Candidatus Latescibacterota bacterium]